MALRIEEDIWNQCSKLLLPSSVSSWKLFNQYIKQPYSDPNRHYHNLTHIRAIFTELEMYKHAQSKSSVKFSSFPSERSSRIWSDLAVVLAIFFHDSIYDPTSKVNEENSVRWMQEALSNVKKLWESERSCGPNINPNTLSDSSTPPILWLDPSSAKFVDHEAARFIMGTKNHFDVSSSSSHSISEPNNRMDFDQKSSNTSEDDIIDPLHLVLDLDLTVFGLSWRNYVYYVKCIRKEYQIYPDEVFMDARYDFIQHVLDQPRFFKTRYFYDKYERIAHENLKREREEIEKAISAGKFSISLD
ncbi:unnamed protein product [Phytomonas sp. Hart1]|nr:unnamed protein product [Phytomonas sp. Hart1]|eukprot:CCW68611.1 unnamed protein product [Phytomonas sp. isolate Hart1]